jgi:hypothetical protein
VQELRTLLMFVENYKQQLMCVPSSKSTIFSIRISPKENGNLL